MDIKWWLLLWEHGVRDYDHGYNRPPAGETAEPYIEGQNAAHRTWLALKKGT